MTILDELHAEFLAEAARYDAEAKGQKMPDGSTAHMCANVWRAAAEMVRRKAAIASTFEAIAAGDYDDLPDEEDC